MALPSRVDFTNSVSAIMIGTVIADDHQVLDGEAQAGIVAQQILPRNQVGKMRGRPRRPTAGRRSSSTNDTPMAETSGASFGARRSGL